MNIYLIGYRCTGKTSVGQCLAGSLEMAFADADRLLEQQTGMHIADYVSRYGWESFRDMEAGILLDLSQQQDLVIATGGGVVLREKNVAQMRDSGIVVWLTAQPDTILERMQNDANTQHQRPAFTSNPLAEEVHQTLD
ncbi:MAG: shikimate kinase, partial [Desulfobacterales bacterium]